MSTPAMPREIIVNPEEKLFYVTPEVATAMPDIREKFKAVDNAFYEESDPSLREMYDSVHHFTNSQGAEISYSVLPGSSNEALVTWAPPTDTGPTSTSACLQFFLDSIDPGLIKKADTNSWNQITKSAVMSTLLKESGVDMPVITIFGPVPDKALKAGHMGSVSTGNGVLREVVENAQEKLHGKSSETQIDTLHLQGSSLGANRVLGAVEAYDVLRSRMVFREGPEIRSITAQELIVGPANRAALLRSYMTDGSGKDVSDIPNPPIEQIIEEPAIRQYVDRGSDTTRIIGRQVNGLRATRKQFKGITGEDMKYHVSRAIQAALDRDIELCFPLAENSSLTKDTAETISDDSLIVQVRATEGERATHYINELVAPTSYLTLQNIMNARTKA